jgi:ubiquinone/menaquinone biosynthesis C-methylase UbiE
VYSIILSHLKDNQRDLAVDVATGSGQAAVQLAEHFKQVCTSLARVDSLLLSSVTHW